jgi:hypothetical protein
MRKNSFRNATGDPVYTKCCRRNQQTGECEKMVTSPYSFNHASKQCKTGAVVGGRTK